VDAATLNDYIGTYDMQGSNFDVSVKDKELFAGRYRLMPVGPDHFFTYAGYADVVFAREDDGRVTKLIWTNPAGPTEWIRNP
jgi:hypothetical protein